MAALAALVLLALAVLIASTLPRRSGRRAVSGLRASLRIETDARGMPTIRAGSCDDALFGLGFVHARDRLWQMELQRRIGSGRLAEALGASLLPTDRFLRTVGFRRAAESALEALSPGMRRARVRVSIRHQRLSRSYGAGFRSSPGFSGSRSTPFDDVDCVVWTKMMAWDLSGNASAEIRRAGWRPPWTGAANCRASTRLLPSPDDTP